MTTGQRIARHLTLTAIIGATAIVPAAHGAIERNEQNCIVKFNKAAAKVAAMQGKEHVKCVKFAGQGKLPPLQTADQCLVADAKQKVAKARGKTDATYLARCADNLPAFGIAAGASAATTANDAAVAYARAMLDDLFGNLLTPAIIDCGADKIGCKCQQAVTKSYDKLAATAVKLFLRCKKNALKEGTQPLPSGAMSSADLELCVTDAGTAGSIAEDGKEKIAKAIAKLGRGIEKKCAAVDSEAVFPGLCRGLAGAALRDCVARRVECRVCQTLNVVDDLAIDCDLLDDGASNGSCDVVIAQETIDLASPAEPADTPGSPGVSVSNPDLITQFGGSAFSLNHARYTRFHDGHVGSTPDSILILIPGFEGGSNSFKLLAENLIVRAAATYGHVVEVWAYDRRSNQLEDTEGLEIAESFLDPQVALDWLYGDALAIPLHPELAAGPNRRAVFHNVSDDVPFIANWTSLVFSRDIDTIVEEALSVTDNVFLGGHSAGTGFMARYAATDFDLSGGGPAQPGYAKLKGMVLLEGGGGSLTAAPSADTLDRIEDKFDGGLFGAVRDQAPRCADGVTACTIANEAVDCAGIGHARCTEPTFAYSIVPGLLNPQVLAAGEVIAIQAATDPNTGQAILRVDQGGPGNNALAVVPELNILSIFLPNATALGSLGSFIDDDGTIAGFAFFVATSVGSTGPVVGGLTTWRDISQPQPLAATPFNGPAPTSLPAGVWGQEVEVTRFDRMVTTFYEGESNFTDWYYPSSGLGVTSVSGVCDIGGTNTCSVGNVGAPCTANGQCSQSLGLNSSALSTGRGRRDIENMTQAAAVDIPVIAFGGSNGLTPVPGNFTTYAQTLAPCSAPSCDGTPRVVAATLPNPAFPTFGGAAGGFEAYITEGIAHVDILTAEDNALTDVLAPLAAFLERNSN